MLEYSFLVHSSFPITSLSETLPNPVLLVDRIPDPPWNGFNLVSTGRLPEQPWEFGHTCTALWQGQKWKEMISCLINLTFDEKKPIRYKGNFCSELVNLGFVKCLRPRRMTYFTEFVFNFSNRKLQASFPPLFNSCTYSKDVLPSETSHKDPILYFKF